MCISYFKTILSKKTYVSIERYQRQLLESICTLKLQSECLNYYIDIIEKY